MPKIMESLNMDNPMLIWLMTRKQTPIRIEKERNTSFMDPKDPTTKIPLNSCVGDVIELVIGSMIVM